MEDKLLSYKNEKLKIIDPEVIKLSDEEYHNILVYIGDIKDVINGIIFDILPTELLLAIVMKFLIIKNLRLN